MAENVFIIILILITYLTYIEPCPRSCQCIYSQRLTYWKAKNLYKVRLGIPQYTERLVLSRNNISSIWAHDFKELPNLRDLDIKNSPLAYFDTEILKRFKNLVSLDLSGNLLTKISKFPFHWNLKSLELQSNLLTHIDGSTFSLLQNLSNLDLGNNRLSNISTDAFKHFENV